MNTLDIEQAAKLLKISTGALSHKARAGVIKAAKPGKRWVFIEEDLIDYIRSLYRTPRQTPLMGGDIGHAQCHSTNEVKLGGFASPLQREKEYVALLELKTKNKRKNSKTD